MTCAKACKKDLRVLILPIGIRSAAVPAIYTKILCNMINAVKIPECKQMPGHFKIFMCSAGIIGYKNRY